MENRFLPGALKQPSSGSTLIVVIAFIKSAKGFNQQKIHLNLCSGIDDWKIALIYQVEGNLHYRQQEVSVRQYKLDYITHGLNEREFPLLV